MRASITYCVLLLSILSACDGPTVTKSVERATNELQLARLLRSDTIQVFPMASEAREFRFPEDHAAHPKFRNEWWYFTGNLTSAAREFGYELTLFRFALTPADTPSTSTWRDNQLLVGHLAISDIANGEFYTAERWRRRGARLAGFATEPDVSIFISDWQIQKTVDGWSLTAHSEDFGLDLALTDSVIVLNGDAGRSQKSSNPGNASYYYSQPRLTSVGELTVTGITHSVNGHSWLDREWSSSALADDQVGWDWFALQLDGGLNLMYYQIRNGDGTPGDYSAGVLSDQNGVVQVLTAEDVDLAVTADWVNSAGDRYPAAWTLRLPERETTLKITPRMADQELTGLVRYWEGSVAIEGTRAGRSIEGLGYVELTGYASR